MLGTDMSLLNCCPSAGIRSNFQQWLAPETDELNLWDVKLRLYRCPSCSTLWKWRSQNHGQQDWDQQLSQVVDTSEFDLAVIEETKAKDGRQAELKRLYEKNGWEWKW
jgi:hypothetical protein